MTFCHGQAYAVVSHAYCPTGFFGTQDADIALNGIPSRLSFSSGIVGDANYPRH